MIMRIAKATLDDALLELYPELLAEEPDVIARRGANTERRGVLVEIDRPRAEPPGSASGSSVSSALVIPVRRPPAAR